MKPAAGETRYGLAPPATSEIAAAGADFREIRAWAGPVCRCGASSVARSTGLHRDPLDLEVAAANQGGDPDEGARRVLAVEVRRVGAVEGLVQGQVGAVDGHGHQVVHGEA